MVLGKMVEIEPTSSKEMLRRNKYMRVWRRWLQAMAVVIIE